MFCLQIPTLLDNE